MRPKIKLYTKKNVWCCIVFKKGKDVEIVLTQVINELRKGGREKERKKERRKYRNV